MSRVRIEIGMRQNVEANLNTVVATNEVNVWETVKLIDRWLDEKSGMQILSSWAGLNLPGWAAQVKPTYGKHWMMSQYVQKSNYEIKKIIISSWNVD